MKTRLVTSILLLSLVAGPAAGAAPKGLVAYWSLDGDSGSAVRDDSGHGRHGVIGPDVRGRDAGLPGGTGQAASISMWFKPPDEAKKGQCPVVFKSTTDPDYQRLLRAVTAAKAYLDKITRFDKPGFKPRPEYIREMKRYGLLPPSFDATRDPIDVYKLDRKYWQSLNSRPKK